MAEQTHDVEIRLTYRDDGTGELEKVVARIVPTMEQVNQQATKNKQGFDKLRDSADKTTTVFSHLKDSFMRSALQMAAGLGIWTSMSAVIGAFTSNVRDIITQGKAFEEAWDKVEIAVNLNEKELSAMQDAVLKMNPALGSTVQLAKAMGIAVRSFTDATPAEWLNLVAVAARAAAATGADVVQVMEGIGRVVKGYGLSISDAAKVTDVLVKASTRADVSMGELTMTLQRLSGPAKIASVTFPELTAAYVKLAQTTGPQRATMQLNVMLMSLAKTSAAARVEAAKYGVDWSAAGIKVNGFVPTLAKLSAGIKGNEEALAKIIPGGRQMAGTLALLENGAKGLQNETAILTNEFKNGGAAATAYYKHFGELGQMMDMAKEMFNKFKIALFQGFSDAIKKSVDDPKELESAVQKMTDSIVDSGRRIGTAIFNAAKWVKDNASTIKTALEGIGVVLIVTKITAWSQAFIGAIASIIPFLGKLAGAAVSVVSALGIWSLIVVPLAIAAAKLIELKNAIDKTTVAAQNFDKANISLSNKLYQMVTSGNMTVKMFYDLTDKYNGNSAAMAMAIEKGKEGVEVQKAYIETFRQVPGHVLAANKALAEKVAADNQQAKDLDLLREKMKTFGYAIKADAIDNYNTLKDGLVKLRGEMTQQKYDELTKKMRELGAETGHYQQTLLDLGILMKGEEKDELERTQKRFTDLQEDLADGAYISWPAYYNGMKKVIEEFQKWDPTFRAMKDAGVKSFVEMNLEQQNLKQTTNDLGTAFRKGELSSIQYAQGLFGLRQKAIDLDETTKTLKDLGIKPFAQAQLDSDKLKEKFVELTKAFKDGKISIDDYAKGLLAIRKAAVELDPVTEAFKKLKITGPEDAANQVTELNSAMKTIALQYVQNKLSLEQYTAAYQEYQDQLDAVDPKVKQMKADEALLGGALFQSDADKTLAKVQAAFDRFKASNPNAAFANLAKAATALGDALKADGKTVPEDIQRIIDASKEGAKTSSNELVRALTTLGGGLEVMADQVSTRFKDLFKGIGAIVSSLAATIQKSLAGKKIDWTGFFQGITAEMATALGSGVAQAITGKTSQFAALGGMVGEAIGQGIVKNMAKQVGKSMSKSLGDVLGSVIPVIGGVVGSLVGGLLGSIFPSKAEKAAKALQRAINDTIAAYKQFGTITQDTAKKIVELTKSTNAATAQLLTLTDVMNDAGISSKNFSRYIQDMWQGLQDIAHGSVDAAKGIKAISDSFTQLLDYEQEMGQEGSKQMISFIQNLRKVGAQIPAVTQYVSDQLGKATTGIKAMTDALTTADYTKMTDLSTTITNLQSDITNLSQSSLTNRSDQLKLQTEQNDLKTLQGQYDQLKVTVGQELAPELERVGTLTVATFNSMIANGATVSDAFAALKDPIEALSAKYTELGLTGNAAIQQLLKIDDVEKANTGLMESIGGNQQVLEALGNTGFITADSLKASAQEAQSFYTKLTVAGMTSQQALATMAPTLEDLAYYAKQYNLKIDDGTQALIDQAKQAGIWKDKGLDMTTVLKNGFDAITAALNKIIDKFDEMGNAASRMGRKVADSTAYASSAGTASAATPGVTYAAHGFSGTVQGPHLFYVEPGMKESVQIGSVSGANATNTAPTVVNNTVERPIVLEPIVLPWKEMESFIIKTVQKAAAAEQITLSPRAVRGRS